MAEAVEEAVLCTARVSSASLSICSDILDIADITSLNPVSSPSTRFLVSVSGNRIIRRMQDSVSERAIFDPARIILPDKAWDSATL